MPKIKSHKGIAKRFRKTASGKLKRKHAGQSHFLEKRTSKRKRKLAVLDTVAKGDKKRISRAVPYL